MATRVESTRNLVGIQSIAYIRPINLTLELTGGRPSTPMNIFFDGVLVNHLCTPNGGTVGQRVNTNVNGVANMNLYIPGGTFTTGEKQIIITDAPDIAAIDMNGSTYGSARTKFTSTGITEIFQTTTVITQINEVVVERIIPTVTVTRTLPPPPAPSDPLAQSFFTYGVTGGCFLTSIDLFFRTKDTTIPVTVDVRPLVNGVPQSWSLGMKQLSCTLNPDDIVISTNATAATRFTFDTPIYLEQDSDYCFVVFSNSKNYNLFTSRVGEKSYETGSIIFNQPYIGSMFKSENNITWTAEQFEDIKFNINIAKFSKTTNAVLKFTATPSYIGVDGKYFYTRASSGLIRVTQTIQHGLEVGSRITINADDGATYNGIPSAALAGTRIITKIVDEFAYEFYAAANATLNGPITTGGQVRGIDVTSKGTNYSSVPTVTISGGGGSGATATAVVQNGEVVAVRITARGTGYTSAPTVTISGGGGSGATADSNIDAAFTILTNKPVNFVVNNIPSQSISDTKISAKLTTTQLNYYGGNLNTYQPAETIDLNIAGRTYIPTNSVIASNANEVNMMSGNPSLVIEYNMSTTNENVSPFIDLSNQPSLVAYNNRIRNQVGESISSENATASISSIVVTVPGTGYTSVPTVVFEGGGGTGAAATAVIAGGSVTAINVTNGGSGYTTQPTIRLTRTDATTGVDADGYTVLTPFNSELTPTSGTSTSRYVTKKFTLAAPSKGINLFSEIYSTQETSVEWYIRTSISGSGVSHSNINWRKLSCDSEVNKSSKPGQVFDYKFYAYDIPEFDTYDLKCVLRSSNPAITPVVNNYRVIIVA